MNRRFTILLGIVCSFALASCAGTGSELGTQVTRNHIRSVRLGMTRAELESVLGRPFEEKQEEPGYLVLTYSRRPFGVRFYPMLWVHLRDNRVAIVYAKRYGL